MHHQEAGFTLVELMMVIFVVGIMAGLVVMAVGGNTSRELKKEATRIQQLLIIAQDEATFSGQEIGFYIDDQNKSYGFLTFNNQNLTWDLLEKDTFAERKLPEGYQWRLDVYGEPVDLKKIYQDAKGKPQLDNWLTADDDKKDAVDKAASSSKKNSSDSKRKAKIKIVPALIFFSDGHYAPFRLQVNSQALKDSSYAVEGDGLGSVTLSAGEPHRNKRNQQNKKP